jgi:hypothetical protein
MNPIAFSLQPFSEPAAQSLLNITGKIGRNGNQLTLRYELQGELADLIIPKPDSSADRHPSPAQRKFALWEATCCEFFLGIKGDPAYWEFNLSPIGDWNVYRLDSYRQSLREELAFTALPFQVQHSAGQLSLDLSCDLSPLVRPAQPLEIAVTTVVQHADGTCSYWALTHCAPAADFHQRDSFTLTL